MTPRARKAAAFCTRKGLFEWNVMPFGLCNALATFQRLMDRVLVGLQWETCLVYLDDIIVLGRDGNVGAAESSVRQTTRSQPET